MKLISQDSNVTINTNKHGRLANATLLKFDGTSKRNSWSTEIRNTFAYLQSQDGFKFYKITGNGKFSILETIPTEVLNLIQPNE